MARHRVPGAAAMLGLIAAASCSAGSEASVGVVVSKHAVAAAQVALTGAPPILLDVGGPREPAEAGPALDTAERLVARGVVAVVGHSNSAASLAAAPVYNQARVVQLAPTTTASAYGDAGAFSFRMVPSDESQASTLVALARQLGGGRAIAVVYENDEYGYGMFRSVERASQEVGLPIAIAAGYVMNEGAHGAWAVMDAAARAEPAVLLWLGRGIPLDTVLPRFRAHAPDIPVVASDALDVERTRENPGGVFTNLYFIRLLDPDDLAARLERLPEDVRLKLVSAEAILTYDAVRLIADAIRAGARTGADVRAYLESLGRTRPAFEGVSGAIHFDATRSVPRPWSVAQLRGDGVHNVSIVH